MAAKSLATLILCLLLPGPAQAAGGPPAAPGAALDSLVATERAFAALSVKSGTRTAFLAYLDDEAVLFNPLPVNGKQLWESRGASKATLRWEPAYAEVSAAGDLGYTTGPWEWIPPPDPADKPHAYGHFVSVWTRRPGGPWRLRVDHGIAHGEGGQGVGSGAFTPGPSHAGLGERGARVDLGALDRTLGSASRAKSIAGAYAAMAAGDFRLNRDGILPYEGLEAARPTLEHATGWFRLTPQASGIAASHDLGYTYGLLEHFAPENAMLPADSSVYVHVWRRLPGQGWKLALAVVTLLKHG